MDADDVASPERFEMQVQYLDDHPDCTVVGGNVLLIDRDGDQIREMCLGYSRRRDRRRAHAGQGWGDHPSGGDDPKVRTGSRGRVSRGLRARKTSTSSCALRKWEGLPICPRSYFDTASI